MKAGANRCPRCFLTLTHRQTGSKTIITYLKLNDNLTSRHFSTHTDEQDHQHHQMAPSMPLEDTTAPALSRRYYYSDDGTYTLSTGLIVAIVIIIIIKIIFWILVCRYCAKRRSARYGAQDTCASLHPQSPPPAYTQNGVRQTDGYTAATTYGQPRDQGVELGPISERDKQLLHAESQVGERDIPQAHAHHP